ncbi:MAG: tetratricopeptide repeat protein [Myxococcota bacterium]
MRQRLAAWVCCCSILLPRVADASEGLDDVRKLLAEEKIEEARATLAALAAAGSSESDVYLYLGGLERSAGRLVRAVAVFEAGLSIAPRGVELLSELAMTYAWSGRLDDAVTTYERALSVAPDDVNVRMGYARVLAWSGRHEESLALYREALEADPRSLEALRGAAFVHRSRMRHRLARTYYLRALSLDADDEEARAGLQSIADARRWELRAGAGAVYFPGSVSAQTEASLKFQVTPELGLRAAHISNIPTGVGDSTGDTRGTVAHLPELGATYRFGERVTADATVQSRIQGASVTYLVGARASIKASAQFVALAGARPGIRHDGRGEVLADLGLQWLPRRRIWLMGQGFYFVNGDAETSWAAVTTVWARIAKPLAVRVGGGGGQIGHRPVGLLFAAPTLTLGTRIELSASYEHLRGAVLRHAGLLSTAVKF